MAASLIVAKKEMGHNIRLFFALPCKNHNEWGSEKQRELFSGLLRAADAILYVANDNDPHHIKQCNRYMVEHSAFCLCALLHEKGGTAQTVRLAYTKGLIVINTATQATRLAFS